MDINYIKQEFGKKIKLFRTLKNYTQEDFCTVINLEQPNLSNIETAKSLPDIITLCSLIKNGNIEPNFLFDFLYTKNDNFETLDLEISKKLKTMSKKNKLKLKAILDLIDD